MRVRQPCRTFRNPEKPPQDSGCNRQSLGFFLCTLTPLSSYASYALPTLFYRVHPNRRRDWKGLDLHGKHIPFFTYSLPPSCNKGIFMYNIRVYRKGLSKPLFMSNSVARTQPMDSPLPPAIQKPARNSSNAPTLKAACPPKMSRPRKREQETDCGYMSAVRLNIDRPEKPTTNDPRI